MTVVTQEQICELARRMLGFSLPGSELTLEAARNWDWPSPVEAAEIGDPEVLLFGPFYSYFAQSLISQVSKVWESAPGSLGMEVALGLIHRLAPVWTKALCEDIKRAGAVGSLHGASPTQRYLYYCKAFLQDPIYCQLLLDRYPLLAFSTFHRLTEYAGYLESLMGCISEDKHLLSQSQTGPSSVAPGQSDFHDGLSVALVGFADSSKWLYKPRSGSLDIIVNQLITEVTGTMGLRHVAPRVLDRGSYSWHQYVEYEPSIAGEDLKAFYAHCGAMLEETVIETPSNGGARVNSWPIITKHSGLRYFRSVYI